MQLFDGFLWPIDSIDPQPSRPSIVFLCEHVVSEARAQPGSDWAPILSWSTWSIDAKGRSVSRASDYHEWFGKDVKSIENLKTLSLIVQTVFASSEFFTDGTAVGHPAMPCFVTPCHTVLHDSRNDHVATCRHHVVARHRWQLLKELCWRRTTKTRRSVEIRHRESQKFSRKPMQNCKHTLFDLYSLLVHVVLVVLLCFWSVYFLCIFCYTFIHVLHIYFVLFTMSFAYSAEFCLKFSCTTY